MTKDEVFAKVKEILVNDFDIEESQVTSEALIGDDLDLDSIDAVEMIVKLKPFINGSIAPEAFKAVKTVEDVVNVVLPLSK
ncbi:MAG: acyl carrier protein [Treponema sp.]|nr:acyl carrier protein [Candidatus Treponema equifaecale]